MFRTQAGRFFPLPDYDLSQQDRVEVAIEGRILDERYTRLLMERTDLDLATIMLLDKVQKRRSLHEGEFWSLKNRNLVEGRRPNLYVSAKVAAVTETKADYIKKRRFDTAHYRKMIVAYLAEFGTAGRRDLDNLLLGKISDALTVNQKWTFISNLLQEMRREKIIRPVGGKRGPGAKWELYKPPQDHAV
jgi:ATP-dependent DNA helicase RecG